MNMDRIIIALAINHLNNLPRCLFQTLIFSNTFSLLSSVFWLNKVSLSITPHGFIAKVQFKVWKRTDFGCLVPTTVVFNFKRNHRPISRVDSFLSNLLLSTGHITLPQEDLCTCNDTKWLVRISPTLKSFREEINCPFNFLFRSQR